MKIKVIVPILASDAGLKSLAETYRKLVRPGTKVEVIGLEKGPETIEYYYDGMVTRGAPKMTFVRGELVMQDGEIVGKQGYGKFVTRQDISQNAS